jgi:pimeloyl-ACP methyl ester carboxylesterase
MMSHPFTGSPTLPFDIKRTPHQAEKDPNELQKSLAELPTPRKHYKWYYSTSPASHEMTEPKEGMHDFLRGYFHLKSADWAGNNPHVLSSFTASELAQLPKYYIMPLQFSMREAVAVDMASENLAEVKHKSTRWLPDKDLAVYVSEFSRNTFQGGLNWYRIATNPSSRRDLELFAGKKVNVPALYVAGSHDWGTFQEPGAVERLAEICTDFKGVHFVVGAGHWVQQEQPDKVVQCVNNFLCQLE